MIRLQIYDHLTSNKLISSFLILLKETNIYTDTLNAIDELKYNIEANCRIKLTENCIQAMMKVFFIFRPFKSAFKISIFCNLKKK